MKNIKYLVIAVMTFGVFTACDTDYIDDPDNPVVAPSSQLLTNAEFDLAYELNDQWVAGRGTLGISQYWGQTVYTDENRYSFRVSQVNDMWNWPYRALTDLKKIIELNEDPATKDVMSNYGSNNNQIQSARIMMAYAFSKLVDTFGDVPYWSYGQKDNSDFQALRLEEGVNSPAYTDALVIYQDLFNELLDAANKIETDNVVSRGDVIYSGSADKWVKFAHSLRLRLASHILASNPTLANQIFNESNDKAFTSNADNAVFTFGLDDTTGGPWHVAFNVNARRDFAPSASFVDLLYNRTGPFSGVGSKDPRVDQYFDVRVDASEVIGVPYGFGNTVARAVSDEGIPSSKILKANYGQPILMFSEVEFIRSQFNGWNQQNYENGVKASMEYWGISDGEINMYIGALPTASEENVLTQKYISLYMDGLEAWNLYRSTGYPKTLTLPGDKYGSGPDAVTFTTLVPGLNTIPNRINYPQNEQLLNKTNWDAAKAKLGDGDALTSKIFWDVVD